MAISMLKRHGRIVVLLALATAAALTIALMAFGGHGPATANAAVKHATRHAAAKHATGKHATRHATNAASDPAGSNQADSQAGGPDPAATPGESSVDSEQGQPGEPVLGNADPAGTAGSDCTGDCVQ